MSDNLFNIYGNSEEFITRMNNDEFTDRYRCKCGQLVGRYIYVLTKESNFDHRFLCPICNTFIEYMDPEKEDDKDGEK